jgi:hypothetical protein
VANVFGRMVIRFPRGGIVAFRLDARRCTRHATILTVQNNPSS